MSHTDTSTTRRVVLSTIGAGLTAGLAGPAATTAGGEEDRDGPAADPAYALLQGDSCTPVRAFRGDEPVEAVYGFHLPEMYVSEENGATVGEPTYASTGTTELQRPQTSIAFLYRGPEGLSLVVVHGDLEARDGGSVTFRLSGLPESGRWLVKDDLYRQPDDGEVADGNHDRWDVDGAEHRVDWTWGAAGTDGGAFGYLGDDFEVAIDPAFNEAAALYGEHYEGTVTDWAFVSATSDGHEHVSLDLDEPILIRPGDCEDGTERDGADEEQGGDDAGSTEADSDGGLTVCHEPPGNPDNAHTIEVGSESAVEAHLGHGDSRGPCPGDG